MAWIAGLPALGRKLEAEKRCGGDPPAISCRFLIGLHGHGGVIWRSCPNRAAPPQFVKNLSLQRRKGRFRQGSSRQRPQARFGGQPPKAALRPEMGSARLEWDRMPRNTLRSKACGERSEDFCTAGGTKVTAFLRSCPNRAAPLFCRKTRKQFVKTGPKMIF